MFNFLPQFSDITAFLVTGLGTMVFKLIEKRYEHHKISAGEELRKELQRENKRLQQDNKRTRQELDEWRDKFILLSESQSKKIEKLESEIKQLRCPEDE